MTRCGTPSLPSEVVLSLHRGGVTEDRFWAREAWLGSRPQTLVQRMRPRPERVSPTRPPGQDRHPPHWVTQNRAARLKVVRTESSLAPGPPLAVGRTNAHRLLDHQPPTTPGETVPPRPQQQARCLHTWTPVRSHASKTEIPYAHRASSSQAGTQTGASGGVCLRDPPTKAPVRPPPPPSTEPSTARPAGA